MKFLNYSKRVAALLMALSMIVLASACGGDSGTQQPATDNNTVIGTDTGTGTGSDTLAPSESASGTENSSVDTSIGSESASDVVSDTQSDTQIDTQGSTESATSTESAATDTQPSTESTAPTESATENSNPDGLDESDILLSTTPAFRVVYSSDDYKSLAKKVMNKMIDLDRNYYVGKYQSVLDDDVKADGTPEILIGDTNRDGSAKAKKLVSSKNKYYAVWASDTAIALYAPEKLGIEMGVTDILTRFDKKGNSVIYDNSKGNYIKSYDSTAITSQLLNTLTNAAKNQNMPVISIAVATSGGIATSTVKGGNPCQNCYSVTKVYCVTAIGILFDQGKIKTTDTIGDIFASEIKSYGVDASKWADITIHDVMRHRAGFKQGGFLDIDSQDATEWGSQDYLKLVLQASLTGNKDYKYTDGAFYLISRVVSKISGKNLDEFLAQYLFNKTDCREYAFASCPQGYPIGATGLYIRSEDVAKLGRIYLDGGKYNGKQIISQKWVDMVLDNGYELGKSGTGYAKGGMRGQNLYINFTKNVAVAWHAYTDHDLGSTLSNAMK